MGNQWIKGSHRLRTGRRSRVGGVYFITTSTWGRLPIFADHLNACAAIRAFTAPVLMKDAALLSWVLMPDHAHWLIRLGAADDLSVLVGKMKSASARNVRRLGYPATVWSSGFHDTQIHHPQALQRYQQYIQQNPIKAGLVGEGCRYWYMGESR